MPFWSRLKHLFGTPIFVEVEGLNIKNITVVLDGQKPNKTFPILSCKVN